MSQDSYDQNEEEQAASQTRPPIRVHVYPTINLPAASNEQASSNDEISKSDKIMIAATIVIALGTIVSACAICFQWYEMHTGGRDTTRIANAAEKQRDAAWHFAGSASGIKDGVSEAVGKLNLQAAATKKLAQTAAVQARESIIAAEAAKKTAETAEETLRRSQRPWLNAESFTVTSMVIPPAGRVSIYGNLALRNTGTSVATDIWSMMVFTPMMSDLINDWDGACKTTDQQIEGAKMAKEKRIGDTWPIGLVLAPNQESGPLLRGIGDPGHISQGELATGFYLTGCARYKDQFLQDHTTRFCFTPDGPIYAKDGTVNKFSFKICEAFQSAD